MNRNQFIAAISVVSALAIGAVAVFFIFFNRPASEDNVVGTEELSSEEIASIEILSTTFLQEASNFGINMDTLTSETVSQRMQDISNDNGGTSWTKRSQVASKLVSEYIDLSGGFPFDFDRITNADWTDGNLVASFKSGTMSVDTDKTASYVYTSRDEPVLLAKVKFNGTSTLAHFTQSADAVSGGGQENHDAESTPWDILEQTIPVEGSLTLSRDSAGDDWRIRGISFQEGEVAFPFWGPEAYTTSYPGVELGGTVVRTVDFPNIKENIDVPE